MEAQALSWRDLRIGVDRDLGRGPNVDEEDAGVDADLQVARAAARGELGSDDPHPRRVLAPERLSQPAHRWVV